MAGSHVEYTMRDKSFFKSEADFIRLDSPPDPSAGAGLTLGIGDDAALVTVPPGQELILTTDMSIEGVHFASALHPPAIRRASGAGAFFKRYRRDGGNSALCLDLTGHIS